MFGVLDDNGYLLSEDGVIAISVMYSHSRGSQLSMDLQRSAAPKQWTRCLTDAVEICSLLLLLPVVAGNGFYSDFDCL